MKKFRNLAKKMIAGICIFGMFVNLLPFGSIVAEASEWSEWSDSKPDIGEEYDLESRTVYRYRDKTTTTSNNSTLSGWTQYDSETTWGNWSEWQDAAVSSNSTRQVNIREMYRYRDKSTTTSNSSTLSGWTQYDSSTAWGSWSEWQDSPVSSSSTRQVNSREMYRYRDKSTTTSNSSTLSGWTKFDSSTTWGSWSAWQDGAVSSSSTRNVETRQVQVTAAYTQYRYGRLISNNCSKGFWAHFCPVLAQQLYGGTWNAQWTDWMNTPVSGVYDGSTCGTHGCYKQNQNAHQRIFTYGGVKYYVQDTRTIPATYKTQYRYQDSITTYYFYKWGDWTSWSTTQPSGNSNREIQNKTQYQYKDSTTTYYFYKWGDWTSWSMTQPYNNSNREIQNKTQYQYKDSTTTYYYYKWDEWTDWSTTQPSSTSSREIENKIQYRYKIVEQPTTEQPTTEQQKVKVGNVTMVPVEMKTDEKPAVDDKVKNKNGSNKVKKGNILESNAGGYKGRYKVTNVKKKTVEYIGAKNKKASSVSVPTEIKINKKKYKVTSIAANAFRNNKKLKKVTIGTNVKTIGKNAFRGCKNLKKVTIGKNVTTIGSHAFYGCKKLNLIEIRSGKLKKVGKAAFRNIAKHPTARVPKGKMQKYQRLFKGKM